MSQGTAHNLQQLNLNRVLKYRAQWRWIEAFIGHGAGSVYVRSTGLTVHQPSRRAEILYHQIAKVSFAQIFFFGAWITLEMEDGQKHRFSTRLERLDYVLEAVAIAEPTLIPAAELAAQRRAIIVTDHLLARMEDTFAHWPTLILMQIVLPAVITLMVVAILETRLSLDALPIFASLGLLNALISLSLWGSLELVEMSRKRKELIENPLNPLRDLKREAKVRLIARIAQVALLSALSWWMWI